MTLSRETLEEWAKMPGSFLLSWTKGVLQDALREAERLDACEYEIFLQGSYANLTHISGTSDVDLVILMKLPLEEDIEALDAIGRANFHARYEETSYGWEEFREDVLATLRKRLYVKEGTKCIDIRHWDSLLRVPADILPAIEYRRYQSFYLPGMEKYEEGVFFRASNGTAIVNFPKQHLRNGRRKDKATRNLFKPVIRVLKNARNHLIDEESLKAVDAPSYFLECLLYNVPNDKFGTSLHGAVQGAVAWLEQQFDSANFAGFCCQNGVVDLFGPGPDQWDEKTAKDIIKKLSGLCCYRSV